MCLPRESELVQKQRIRNACKECVLDISFYDLFTTWTHLKNKKNTQQFRGHALFNTENVAATFLYLEKAVFVILKSIPVDPTMPTCVIRHLIVNAMYLEVAKRDI